MNGSVIGLYQSAWGSSAGRDLGHDEDVVTLAVAAGLQALDEPSVVKRVVVVTATPDVLEGFGTPVIARGLRLPASTPVELRVGGSVAALDALVAASPGTMVIGVDPISPVGAAAILVGSDGLPVTLAGVRSASLPMRVQYSGAARRHDYDDARLERERAWVPAIAALTQEVGSDQTLGIAGVGAKDARRLGGQVEVPTRGASAPFFVLAELVDQPGARIVALEAGLAAAVKVTEGSTPLVRRLLRPVVDTSMRPRLRGAETVVPISLPAYERAFEAKIGMLASRCDCGNVEFPPRSICPSCGSTSNTFEELPRVGSVYTGVAVHVPVPGVPGPYAVVIADLDGTDLRVLAHVTDSALADPVPGSPGRLVLRRVAVREGVPDYGYAWQPGLEQEGETR